MLSLMPLSSIRVELAADGSVMSDQAKHILSTLYYGDGYPFGVESGRAAILCVGYVGELAVTAAACYESVLQDPAENDTKVPFVGLPFLGINLLATLGGYRRDGYGRQLVGSVLNLATDHNFDRVEAFRPGDDARMFWGRGCGFKTLPYESFGSYDMYRKSSQLSVVGISAQVVVSSLVSERLISFTQAQTSN